MKDEILVFLLMIPLAIIAYALYLSPWWVRWLYPRVRWCFAGRQTQRAKVIDMQEKYPLYLRNGGWFKTWDEEVFHTHYAVFKLEDGTKRTMRIGKLDYQGILTGAEGMLTHKGNWFQSFDGVKVGDDKQ